MGYIILILILVCATLSLCVYRLYKKDYKIKEINREQDAINERLASRGKELENEIRKLEDEESKLNLIVKNKLSEIDRVQNTLQSTIANQEYIVKEKVSQTHAEYVNQLNKEYDELIADLFAESKKVRETIKNEQDKLKQLEDKQIAFIKEQQHKEEMLAQKDYYRLNLSSSDEDDIKILRDMQVKMSRKEAVDKIIWEVYYKPAYTVLMAHLFKTETRNCGIYKITCIDSGKAYIGQSVDLKTRMKEHTKSALSIAPTSNKLYLEMKKYQPSNFLFEVLEFVPRANLNERETYWINFYKTKDFGLNTTRGGS